MTSRVFSGALTGIEAERVEVEVAISYGVPSFEIVGLGDRAIEESKERIIVALKNAGFKSPRSQTARILVNLAPADLKKEGTLYDLPIALGFLLASKQVTFDPEGKLILGELALDGRLRPIKGALLFALLAQKEKFQELILPKENAPEAALAKIQKENLSIKGASSLREVVNYLAGKNTIPDEPKAVLQDQAPNQEFLLSLVKNQEFAKRALEISAAGLHHLLLEGPPGTGKTLLAKSLCTLLPDLSEKEALEVTQIYSVAGLLTPKRPFISRPPFRTPHHTTSEIALIGGGSPPRPGEITLAHRGILFLDEFPEFHRDVLESLRQPMEEGSITILRARHQLTFPARFTLVAAANPCPCGYYRNPERECSCTIGSIQKYKRKLSGPLIDRVDLVVQFPQLKFEELSKENAKEIEKEKMMRKRIINARIIQKERLKSRTNSQMTLTEIKNYCSIDTKSKQLLAKYVDSGLLSARGYHKVLKVARTIADLEESNSINFYHVSEALSFRIREA